MTLEKYSIGTGDRFAREAAAQLAAVMEAGKAGVDLAIVWNKSNREHEIIHSMPESTRSAADRAVREAGWPGAYHVDADHINLKSVDRFVAAADFFTIDVAEYIGAEAGSEAIEGFVAANRAYLGNLAIPGIPSPIAVTETFLRGVATRYLRAVTEAGRIYRHIEEAKGAGNFIVEISIDETDIPQAPGDLAFIPSASAREGVPIQTIAPRFSGRFNKGVDYVGDPARFGREFGDDMAVVAWAIGEFGMMENLKLSVHSGSDKFAIYPEIRKAMETHGAGIHIKTAGTTWLEELIGLAEGNDTGLAVAKEIYRRAWGRQAELSAPYASVIDIVAQRLPHPDQVDLWAGSGYAAALRHDRTDPAYNPDFRQLLHLGFKVASELGDRYLNALEENRKTVSRNVTHNLLERHIRPLFL